VFVYILVFSSFFFRLSAVVPSLPKVHFTDGSVPFLWVFQPSLRLLPSLFLNVATFRFSLPSFFLCFFEDLSKGAVIVLRRVFSFSYYVPLGSHVSPFWLLFVAPSNRRFVRGGGMSLGWFRCGLLSIPQREASFFLALFLFPLGRPPGVADS